MRIIQRLFGITTALAVVTVTAHALADAPSTQPGQPAGAGTPQESVADLSDDKMAAMTIDQATALIAYNSDSDKEKAAAQKMATLEIAVAKLEMVTRHKWGKDAEVTVTHLLWDNTLDELAKADWAVDGDRAVANPKRQDASPIPFIRKDGLWKIDLAGILKLEGEDADQFTKDQKNGNAMLDQLNQDIAKDDAYPNADAFVQHVKDVENKYFPSN
jgi:hypothetical protein